MVTRKSLFIRDGFLRLLSISKAQKIMLRIGWDMVRKQTIHYTQQSSQPVLKNQSLTGLSVGRTHFLFFILVAQQATLKVRFILISLPISEC